MTKMFIGLLVIRRLILKLLHCVAIDETKIRESDWLMTSSDTSAIGVGGS